MTMRKRLAAMVLMCFVLLSAIPMHAFAADILIYTVGDGFLGLNRFTGLIEKAVNIKGELKIPSVVQGVPVTGIADSTFYNFEEITSLEIPSTVKTIGDRAFGACTRIKSVKIDEGLTRIGKNTFQYCYSLTDVSLPSTLTAIDSYAFASCIALKSITIPANVTSIGSYAFSECKLLSNISLPGGLLSIGDYGFSNCTALTSIVLPKKLETISTALFSGCTALQNVTVPSSVRGLGKSSFSNCTSLEKLILPEGVREVADWAFTNCRSLRVLSMPDSINGIAADSFYGCENVTFYVNAGSYSQVFASANKIPFKLGTLDPGDPDPDEPLTPFDDISTHWAKSSIEWAYTEGYFSGTAPTKFSPNANVNRAMIVTVLYRMAGEPAVSPSSQFTDVPASSYYAKAVSWGASVGVVSGMTPTKFAPMTNITREQFASMLYRFAQYQKRDVSKRGDLSLYKDWNKISTYAYDGVSWAVGMGIIAGKTGAMLEPKSNATRAEATVMLKRYEDTASEDI